MADAVRYGITIRSWPEDEGEGIYPTSTLGVRVTAGEDVAWVPPREPESFRADMV